MQLNLLVPIVLFGERDPSHPVVFHGQVATLWQQFLKELKVHIRATKGCLLDGRGAITLCESKAESQHASKTSDGLTKSENRGSPRICWWQRRTLFQLFLRGPSSPGSLLA